MMAGDTLTHLAECISVTQAVAELGAGFANFSCSLAAVEEVSPEEMPPTARRLLVHPRHMTVVLTAHYGLPVDMHVLERYAQGNSYRRKVMMTLQETDRVVEYGLARVDLEVLGERVRQAVLQEHAPIGSILVAQNVVRRIQPRWYLRLGLGSPLLRWFGCPTAGPLYGRVTTIYCDGEPAIELLEIVTALRCQKSQGQ